tara:strand:+ start:89 stop:316 length:228 start_codon:yes stop_codon:yes gene_type:complete
MRYLNVLFVSIISFWVIALSGCGQKGDLYLPDIPPAPNVVSVNNAPKDHAEKLSDDDPKRNDAKKNNHMPTLENE